MVRNQVRFDPFTELASFGERFFDDDDMGQHPGTPTTDIYIVDANRLVVETHFPDFVEENIYVGVDRGALIVQAEKHETEEDRNRRFVMRESSTSFYRRISLPEVADENEISATFEHGILRVTIPFVSAPSAKRITINVVQEPTEPGPVQVKTVDGTPSDVQAPA